MAMITTVALFFAGILRSVLCGQLTRELGGWTDWLVKRILKKAVMRLPESRRERYEEEWRSHLNEVPGQIGKVWLTVGFLGAAQRMTLTPGHEPLTIESALRRLFDFTISSMFLVLCLPVFPLIGLAIRLERLRSVAVFEERIGINGRKFKMYKFRHGEGSVGKFLYNSRLTEIPLLFNVVRGDMSLIGPRPWKPRFVEQISTIYPASCDRMRVRPGILGWAEVNRGEGAMDNPFAELVYDRFYIDNRSLKLDIQILLRSLRIILLGYRESP